MHSAARRRRRRLEVQGACRFPREAGKTSDAFEMLLLERKRNSRVIEP
jgi:hypothetical protein